MLALRVTVPMACWRRGLARELFESERLPPPSTCYGMLLSLVGEVDRETHVGARVTSGLLNHPQMSQVLRTLWRLKDRKKSQGEGANAAPDFQQLIIGADIVVIVDSSEEQASPTLEDRVASALDAPSTVERFGGLSLGESTHLVNDIWLLEGGTLPSPCDLFLLDDAGDLTLPVWVDHVGTRGTVQAVGSLQSRADLPAASMVPQIMSQHPTHPTLPSD